MTKAKVWLLLLVALLLPFKGALAAAGVFCHLGSSQPIGAIVTPHHHEAVADHGHGDHHASHVAVDDNQPSPTGASCAICSAVCGAPPLPVAATSLHAPLPSGAERFPPLASPRSSSRSEGLERPPRTI